MEVSTRAVDSRLVTRTRVATRVTFFWLPTWLVTRASWLATWLETRPSDSSESRSSHCRVTVNLHPTNIFTMYVVYQLGSKRTPGRYFRYHSVTVGILGKHFDELSCIWTFYKMVQNIFFSSAHKSNMAAKTWIFSWKITKILDFSPKCYKASDSNAVFGSFD